MNHNIVHMNHKRFDITIHGLDASVYRRIEDRARRQHTSLNRTIKEIIEQSVGGAPRTVENPFADLCGILPADEAALLLEAEEDFERVDPEDWL